MRPVPRTGQVSSPTTSPNPTRQGWNLKWRRSSNVAVEQDREPYAAAADRRETRQVARTSGALAVATDQPQLQAVSPAAYLNTPTRTESLLDSPRGSVRVSSAATDQYFDAPLGTPRFTADDRVAQGVQGAQDVQGRHADHAGSTTLVQTGEMLFPDLDSDDTPPKRDPFAEDSPANDLRQSFDTPDSSADVIELPAPEPSNQSAGRPNPSIKNPDDGPTLGDLLKGSNPEKLPEPASPSNKQMDEDEFENPFGIDRDRDSNDEDEDEDEDKNEMRAKDRQDRDRLNLDGPDREASRFDDEENEELKTTEGLSCNEFRSRIRRQTIDQVSLDISPPYRPDEIDQSRYDKLKAKFDEKQVDRQWRNISGVPIATGRLRDLAYERVVIETQYGSTETISLDDLSEGDLAYVSENYGLPIECRLEQVAFVERSWTPMTFTWKASNLCHNPLYFEDVNLERYGHTHGPILEPFVQTAHFFGNIAVLPYKMGVHCPTECQYALGYYRPGNCAPWITPPVPISVKGAAVQAATMTGLILLIP